MSHAAEVLGPEGPLAQTLEGFQPRPEQQEMAAAVERTLAEGGTLVAEAGTGTGKTFAYLAPVLLSGRKVLISTGTKNLQDQLYHRDLPLLRRALGVPFRIALLKGRASYLCRYRLERTWQGQAEALDPTTRGSVQAIWEWAQQTRSGDRAELTSLAEDAAVWPRVTSTSDNCLGTECPFYDECFLIQARREAQEAECVVVNHHLFCADLALKSEGLVELLPRADAVIFDEAHQLPGVASRFFGVSLTSYGVRELARDSRDEYTNEAGDDPQVPEAAAALEPLMEGLRLACGGAGLAYERPHRGVWGEWSERASVDQAVAALQAGLERLEDALAPHAPRGKGLQRCAERAAELRRRLDFLSAAEDSDFVFWFEVRGKGLFLHATPLEVARPFQEATSGCRGQAWVFTSATLAVRGRVDHFCAKLGLGGEVEAHQWPSSFDFEQQALFYLPKGLPEPRRPEATDRVIDTAIPVLEASGGGGFLLFTSYRALERAASRLRHESSYPLLVQGEGPRAALIQRFRELGNAVLLGTSSFWEGVDVRGPALSVVVIDKLPFPSPSDPVVEARDRYLARLGIQPFLYEHLPAAVLALKQGVGRLIRDPADSGVLVVCDPRLRQRAYGQVFLDSLPPMPRVEELASVRRFFDTSPTAGAGPVGGASGP